MLDETTEIFSGILGDDLGPISISFQERIGIGDYEDGELIEWGFVAFTTPMPDELSLSAGQLLVYTFPVNGFYSDLAIGKKAAWEGPTFEGPTYPEGSEQLDLWFADTLQGTIDPDLDEDDAEALAADFAEAFPGSTLEVLPLVDELTASGLPPQSLAAARAFLLEREEVESIELWSMGWQGDPLGTGPLVAIDDALDDGPIELHERYAFLGRWVRQEALYPSYTLPSLTYGYGPGFNPESPLRRYLLLSNYPDCADEIEACGFHLERGSDDVILVDPSYIAASALRVGCIGALQPLY